MPIRQGQCPICGDTLQYGFTYLNLEANEANTNVRCDRDGCGWQGEEGYDIKFNGMVWDNEFHPKTKGG